MFPKEFLRILLLGELAQPRLDHVHPRCAFGREVQLEARVPLEPPLHVGLGTRPQIVHHDVYVEVAGDASIYGAEEDQELLVAVPLVELGDDHAVEYVQSSEEVYPAVALVIVGPRSRHPRAERQDSLAPVECLYAALLVHADDYRLVWRVHVEPELVPRFLVEPMVRARLGGALSVGLYPVALPDSGHGRVAHPDLPREGTGAPMRGASRLAVESAVYDRVYLLL